MPTRVNSLSSSAKKRESSRGLALSNVGADLSPLAGIYWAAILGCRAGAFRVLGGCLGEDSADEKGIRSLAGVNWPDTEEGSSVDGSTEDNADDGKNGDEAKELSCWFGGGSSV